MAESLKDKLLSIIEEVRTSEDKDDIQLTLCMLKDVFECLSTIDPEKAEELLKCYEGSLRYYNFLTEEEAEEIVKSFKNSDGTEGGKWGHHSFISELEKFGGKMESQPYYNEHALYTAMNMVASDHSQVIKKWVEDPEEYVQCCYDLATSILKDKDRPYWIRDYFHLGKVQYA